MKFELTNCYQCGSCLKDTRLEMVQGCIMVRKPLEPVEDMEMSCPHGNIKIRGENNE